MANYTSKEVAEILNVSDRAVRRYLNGYFSIENGAYQISEKMLDILKIEHLGQVADNLGQPTDSPAQEFERVEYFTEEEYQEFHRRLVEYPLLKERTESLLKDIGYHRKSIESHNRQMELILLSITNKKFIEE
jgi:transcriptional regulator with XRE-family HTH domain